MSPWDTFLGAAFMLAPTVTVAVAAVLGSGNEISMLAGLIMFVLAGWLNERLRSSTTTQRRHAWIRTRAFLAE